MSQIVMSPNTQKVLELAIPEWTKLLDSVNFEGIKLTPSQRDQMNVSPCGCFIGELHYRDQSYDGCNVCRCLSILAPYVFNTTHYKIKYPQELLDSMELDGFKFENDSEFRSIFEWRG